MPPLLPSSSVVRGLSIRSFSTSSPACALRDNSSSRPSSSSSLLSINNSSSSSQAPRGGGNPGDAATSMLHRLKRDGQASLRNKQAQIEQLRNQKNSADYLRQMPRRWEAGDVYSPHDMSPVEMQKWRKRSPRKADVVDALGIRPLDMYKNFSLIQEFTSTSGQITHSSGTSLRPVNQRKIAKMIRRVQGMGLYPTIHAHPEMIRDSFFPERR
ncbi:ribosomal protein S18 [Trichoderma citrinoviride]|uniref:Small ribosomal subunit protein bS18m n=1 Tax=Trichoderma citrinoviride TaxID=58853 RepID=A0A2T4BHA0_9HYPO|nr:ribosomal protein S18 [Trichoderma citrinoviride]PTB68619.1 ribosomal protein S18 [Trichoderma citrinoviride]